MRVAPVTGHQKAAQILNLHGACQLGHRARHDLDRNRRRRISTLHRQSMFAGSEIGNLGATILNLAHRRTIQAHGPVRKVGKDGDARRQRRENERDVGVQDVYKRQVVKTFLDFTRPVELNYRVVPLAEVLGEIEDLARPQAEAEKIRMVVEQGPDGVEVRIDRDMFKQAVLNVVVNAMQSMPGGGELRLECSTAQESVEIRISDTGAGIPPELREKIFRLYFTTKQGGSGIGLAMTFRIVQLHDGTIDFNSEPGKGTTFVIRLPIAV